MSDSLLLHITTQTDWKRAQAGGEYYAASLETDGFIHLSTPAQIEATANRFYHGQGGLLVLVLEISKLTASLRYETVPGHGIFPHLFGPINLDAIVRVVPIVPRLTDGLFDLAQLLANA